MASRTSRITRKGQITIPVDLRRDLDLHEGDTVMFTRTERGIEVSRPKDVVAATAGIFKDYVPEGFEFDRDRVWREIADERIRQPAEDG